MDGFGERATAAFGMRFSLMLVFLLLQGLAYAQDFKFGLRSGVGFSNFYAHQLHGEIPNFSIKPVAEINGQPALIDPNTPNSPSYYYKTDLINDIRPGVYSYLYVDFELEPRLSGQIAVGYRQKGINMSFGLQNSTVNSDNSMVTLDYRFNRNVRLDYITVPLTLQYQLDQKKRFYGVAGVYNSLAVNFLINESLVATKRQIVGSSGQAVTSESESQVAVAYANRFDAGLLAGIGLNLPLSRRLDIGVDVRGSLGLLNVPKAYENYGFLGFSKSTKNIGLETGLKLQYTLD
jgi:hypothetical protein